MLHTCVWTEIPVSCCADEPQMMAANTTAVQSPACLSWSLLRAGQEVPFPYQKEDVKKIRSCFFRTILLLWGWGALKLELFKCSRFVRDFWRAVGAAMFPWAFLKGVVKKQTRITSQQLYFWWMSWREWQKTQAVFVAGSVFMLQ